MKNKPRRGNRTPFELARFSAMLTQGELAERAGLSLPSVGKVERTPWECSEDTLEKYIGALPDGKGKSELRKLTRDVLLRKKERELAGRFGEHAAV